MNELVCPVPIECDVSLASVVALSGLPNLTPRRFWQLLGLGDPIAAWNAIVSGTSPLAPGITDTGTRWQRWAQGIDPSSMLESQRHAGVTIHWHGSPSYPTRLIDDPEPPVLLYCLGTATLDPSRSVAIVGTRRCTAYGRNVARELAAALGSAGATIVSGLAHGIDATAHAAVLAVGGSATAVVAGGVDIVYPRSNRALYESVSRSGALVSEWPLRARALPWRFPARNRTIAGLSDAVVVVESAERGGSMYTVDEAANRNRRVFAVPGPITSTASSGTNRLIADGAEVALCADDLIETLGLKRSNRSSEVKGKSAAQAVDSWLLTEVDFTPTSIDLLVAQTGRSVGEFSIELERLLSVGAIRRIGATVERVR